MPARSAEPQPWWWWTCGSAAREVVEPERIVFTLSDRPPPDAGHALVIVELAEVGEGRTEKRLEQRSSLSAAQTSAARCGWSRFFDRLAERLAAG